MKVAPLYIFLAVLLSCQYSSDTEKYITTGTYITDEISVAFPDSLFETRMISDSLTIYASMNDSIEYHAAVAKSKNTFHTVSNEEIEGIDANLFMYIQTQKGENIKTSEIEIDGQPATRFDYESDYVLLRDKSVHKGILLYYKNYMVVIEFVNRNDLEEIVSRRKAVFLGSLRIN